MIPPLLLSSFIFAGSSIVPIHSILPLLLIIIVVGYQHNLPMVGKNHHKSKFFESLDSTSSSSWDLNVVHLYCLVNGICNWLRWSPICWKITFQIPQKTPIIIYQFILTYFPVCDVYPIHQSSHINYISLLLRLTKHI